MTPYVAQRYHDEGVYFASHGYPFLTVDVRGRGNSEGIFEPNFNEARDGPDVVEWLARQPYCNGKVSMWGASYGGHAQWMTASELPPHLSTIVPVASPFIGVDFPIRGNIATPYLMQWLTLVSGRTSQDEIFWKEPFWSAQFRAFFESGLPFKNLDTFLGNPSDTFQEWLAHPHRDTYWDSHNPSAPQYARLAIPILTITGVYDGDQPGALMHYREHLRHTDAVGRASHYLVIGPWDHSGTRLPKAEFAGLRVGPDSLVDLRDLHLQWYAWTMDGGPKPPFLRKNVAYYVMGAERWCYADTLEAITERSSVLYLHSTHNPTDLYRSGSLAREPQDESLPDHYVYDPRDLALAELESSVEPESIVDQRMLHGAMGSQLVYHSEPFAEESVIAGFFKLSAWLSIDQPDTDFRVSVHEIAVDGSSVLLSGDTLRARYRESLYEESPVLTTEPLRYDFERFTFVARRMSKGSRLRLVIGPINSIYSQKNFNSGAPASEESMQDARPVVVRLLHDRAHPSVLHIPIGRNDTEVRQS
jgi:putative CocE/NonD family hydrolase